MMRPIDHDRQALDGGLRPRLTEAQVLLRSVGLSPFVRVDRRGDRATIQGAARGTCFAKLDLETGALTVFVGAELANQMLETDPSLRLTRDGVRLDVHGPDARAAGERLIRRRSALELFGPQWRAASP